MPVFLNFPRYSQMACILFGFALGTSIAWSDSEISKEIQQEGHTESTRRESTKEVDGHKVQQSGTEQPQLESPAKPDQLLKKVDVTKPDSVKKTDGQPDEKQATGKKDLERREPGKTVPQTSTEDGKPQPLEKNASKNSPKNAPKNAEKTGGKQPEKGTVKKSAKMGDKKGEEKKRESGDFKGAGFKNGEMTAEHESQALEFASKHHPELVGLISPLKVSNPKEYQRAIRELFRTSERLNNIRLREPARYDLELEAWKLQSLVRLLAARLVMESDSELQASLKDAIRKKADNRLRLMQYEKESLKNRLEQVSKDIEKSSKSLDQSVDQEYERLLKLANREKPEVPKAKKVRNHPPVAKE